MSLADDLERAAPARIVAKIPPKILTLDIERLPGQAQVQCRGLTITGAFWDLSGWKHTIGRRIRPDEVLEWPRTICAAWRWYGARKVHFAAEWEPDGRDDFIRRTHAAYHEADLVIGHNVKGFDTKKLRWDWVRLNLTPPSPSKYVDTLSVARSVFGAESNQLGSLCTELGIPTKTDRYDPAVAQAACDGDVRAQRRIRLYNQGDIVASEALYDRFRPWMPSHPHIGLWSGEQHSCGHCGGTDLKDFGWHRAEVTAYARYQCQTPGCGAWYRPTHIKARTTTRPAR